MSLFHLSTSIYAEALMGFLLWWFAVYLISKNPFDRAMQLLFLIFFSLSFYLTSDVFFILSVNLKEYSNLGLLLKISTWSIYLPYALIFHLSCILQKGRSVYRKIALVITYAVTAIIIYVEAGTGLMRNYELIRSDAFEGYIPSANGKYFWLISIPVFLSLALTAVNFFKLIIIEKRYSVNWFKYFWPLLAIVINLLAGPFIVLSYYGIVPHSEIIAISLFVLTAVLFAYSVIKYRLFIEEPRILFGKNLIYSTLVTFITVIAAIAILTIYPLTINHTINLLMPILLVYFVALILPLYNWLITFLNDLQFNAKSGLSVVADADVYNAVKNYQNPEMLEESPLLDLVIVRKKAKKENITLLDSLRLSIEEAIEYFGNSGDKRRTKQNLKYQLLKMVAYDQAEEGQVLWELGFEDYPLNIMTREGKSRPPKFKDFSPADYSYISRNAFLALKKEAIHDVTWRISYLEKLSRRKMF